MRKLMWFTIGFSLASGLLAFGLAGEWKAVLLGAAVASFAGSWVMAKRGKAWKCAAVTALGCLVGFGWFGVYHGSYLASAAELDGITGPAVITVSDFGYETNFGSAADGRMELAGKNYTIRVYVNETGPLSPGDTVTGNFRFRLTTPDAEKGTYHSGKGIFLLAYQRGNCEINRNSGDEGFFVARLAQRIKEILKTCFPEDVFPFVQAILLGDAYDLPYERDVAFQVSGVRHVVAVSGLHVSILVALLGFVTLKNRFLTAMVGFPLLTLFAAVAGFTPSVTRACLMAGLMLLALVLNKEYDGPTALSFAVLTMQLGNPLVITAVGFQLSVLSVAGIQLFHPGLSAWLKKKLGEEKGRGLRKRLKAMVASSVSMSFSATALTTPLSAYYFGTVSLIAPLTNLLVLWLIGFIFYGVVLVCLLSLLWLPGAMGVAWVISWPVRYIYWITEVLSKFPLSAVYTESRYSVWWLVFVYILLGMVLLQKRRRILVPGCLAVLSLCAALLVSWTEPMWDNCRVTVLDVGQGQSILLQSEGKSYLIDCGGDNDEMTADLVARTLLSQGINRLDGLVLTHLDRDHAGGASYLLRRIPTDLLLIPYTASPEEAAAVTEEMTGQVISVRQDLVLSYGNVEMHIFAPYYAGSDNENSLCILFDTEKCDILITGDRSGFGERLLLRKNVIGDVDVLVAGHHGSDGSTCQELLDAVRPEIVCISVSEDNSYGHPGGELLARLEAQGCTVRRTDQDGTILIRR